MNEPGNSATAAALLTIRGTPDDAASELTRPDLASRSIALQLLAFRSDGVAVLHAIDNRTDPISGMGAQARKQAELTVAKRTVFDQEFAAIPSPSRPATLFVRRSASRGDNLALGTRRPRMDMISALPLAVTIEPISSFLGAPST